MITAFLMDSARIFFPENTNGQIINFNFMKNNLTNST